MKHPLYCRLGWFLAGFVFSAALYRIVVRHDLEHGLLGIGIALLQIRLGER
jgi:hypothetical protein